MGDVRTFTAGFLFCGLGAGARGFLDATARLGKDQAKFVNLGGIDNDPLACADFEYLTGAKATEGDLSKMTPRDLRAAWGDDTPDCVFLSPPCLPGKEEVLTAAGPAAIEGIRAGTLVLAHSGKYRRVLKVGSHLYHGTIYGLRLNGSVDMREFTAEHPILRRRVVRTVDNRKRHLGPIEFAPASELKIGDRIGFPVVPERAGTALQFVRSVGDPSLIVKGGKSTGRYAKPEHEAESGRTIDLTKHALSPDLWFLLGVYLGDGYRRPSRHEVVFCVGGLDDELRLSVCASLKALGLGYGIDASQGITNVKIRVHARHLSMLCGAFGDGAERKTIPEPLMALEGGPLVALFEGYFAADGSSQPRRMARRSLQPRRKIASVSLPLLRAFQRLLLRRGEFWSINKVWPGGPQVIDRGAGPVTVQTRPRYELVHRAEQKKRAIAEFGEFGETVWIRLRSIAERKAKERVWNLEVEEDNTFCSPLIATHNCKGFSGLLPKAAATTEKYQALNRLVLQGMFLVCETWKRPPTMIVLENVPRIRTRGAQLLGQVRDLLRTYGYVFNEATHDCGEIGNLAQHRYRYLLVCRLPKACPAYVYRPPKRPVRACGEVLGDLPLPQDPEAGELHKLPKLSWINWVRLALIPAGGDWRDLPGMKPKSEGADPTLAKIVGLKATADGAEAFNGRPGLLGVGSWEEPAPTVTGNMRVSGGHGTAAVADPRVDDLAVGKSNPDRGGALGVIPWTEPAPCVTGSASVTGSNTPASVADPRAGDFFALGHEPHRGTFGVVPWDEPAPCVRGRGDVRQAKAAVADPRARELAIEEAKEEPDELRNPVPEGAERRSVFARWAVNKWDEPTPTVAGSGTNGAFAVADQRALGLSNGPNAHRNKFAIADWSEPAPTVIGATRPGSGAPSVSDPRVPEAVKLKCRPWAGYYGVMSWQDAADSVTGSAQIDNGRFAVADPRKPPEKLPVIIAADGTWHRPLTTLELAALQGIPTKVNGKPLQLAGKSVAGYRERIGNAVPVQAGRAIAETLLTALLAAALGTWTLGSTGIWVRRDGVSEDEANAPYEEQDRAIEASHAA